MSELPDLARYTTTELGNFIRDLRLRIADCQARLESPSAPRRRTIRLIRGTILAVGGIFGLSIDIFSVILTALGFWDWIEAISDDVNAMNEQLRIQRLLAELFVELEDAESELDRRIAMDRTR